jgi:hypothetical protein
MANERYIRWQGLGIAQLSVAVALVSGFSVAGLGAALSLLQSATFQLSGPFSCSFVFSLFLLLAASFCSIGAVITRLLDFRLTARKVRKDTDPNYDKPLILFRCNSEQYGCATWRLFWASCLCFVIAAFLFVASVVSAYAHRLL